MVCIRLQPCSAVDWPQDAALDVLHDSRVVPVPDCFTVDLGYWTLAAERVYVRSLRGTWLDFADVGSLNRVYSDCCSS